MRRYRFALAAVLRLRRAEHEVARNALAVANAELRARLAERDREAEHYGEVTGRSLARTLEELAAEREDAAIALARLQGADQRVAEAGQAAALAQVGWLAAHRKVAALERLETRQREEHALALGREEGALVDDLTTARYVAAKARDQAVRP
jgi:flagellar export protein FliJ